MGYSIQNLISVIAIAILQSSQSQSPNNEKNAQNPQNNQFGSDDIPESLRRGNWGRGRYDYDMDLDIEDYIDRDVPYHEGYMSARMKSSHDRSTGITIVNNTLKECNLYNKKKFFSASSSPFPCC